MVKKAECGPEGKKKFNTYVSLPSTPILLPKVPTVRGVKLASRKSCGAVSRVHTDHTYYTSCWVPESFPW